MMRQRKLALAIKRIGDVVIAATGMVLAMPFMVIIACAIRLDSPGTIFFRQLRVGLHGQPFRIYKFRSMVVNADRTGPVTSVNDARVTRVGRFLRLSSLDELPQLINILRGDMSVVGPRPLIQEALQPGDARRLDMRPGVTGPVAVNGRQMLSWDDRIKLDLWYVDNWSLWLDGVILLRTVPVVLLRKGVYDRDGEMKVRT